MSKNKYEGFIIIHRKFKNWEWYDNPATRLIFEHCLYSANFKDEVWQGLEIKRGQFPTSIEKLANANGLSIRQTRTALKNLQKTNEIDIQTTSRYSLITVNNWDLYQAKRQTGDKQNDKVNDKQMTCKTTCRYSMITGDNRNVRQSKRQANDMQNDMQNDNTITNINKERDNKLSLSIEEREILKNYLLELNEKRKNKIEDIDAYIRKLVENGDCLTKLEKAKKKLERQKAKDVIPPPEKIEKEPEEEVQKTIQNGRKSILETLKRVQRDEK